MKIRVSFTLDIPDEYLDALMKLSATDNRREAADFVRVDAQDYVTEYLDSNGILIREMHDEIHATREESHVEQA
jgi:hypothetical protein